MDSTGQNWLIWSNEHKAWWAPREHGYCRTRAEAGRYSYERAIEIVRNANIALKGEPHEAMVLDERKAV